MNGPIATYFEEFREWTKKPYSDDLTMTGWILFLGLVTVVTFLWASVIRQIKEAAS